MADSIGLAAVENAQISGKKVAKKVAKKVSKSKCHKSGDLCKMATWNNLTIKVHSDIFVLCDAKKSGKEKSQLSEWKGQHSTSPHPPQCKGHSSKDIASWKDKIS